MKENVSSQNLKIWVYGAGAVGSYYGGRLSQLGHQVLFISRGKQLKALKENGLQVQSCDGDFVLGSVQACTQEELPNQFTPDLVIIATKRYSNDEVVSVLKKTLPGAIPLFILQNGINSENIFVDNFGSEQVTRAVLNIAVALEKPGFLQHKAGGYVILQENGIWPQKLLAELQAGGVKGHISKNIQIDAWSKIVWNASFNTVTALSGLTTKNVLADEDGYQLVYKLGEEVRQLALQNGIELPLTIVQDKIKFTQDLLGDISTSTLEDVRQGKKIEYEAIVGDLVENAKKLKISVPYLETVYTLLKLLDKNHLAA
jgi:2-dehydropantoate 2-reductase